MGSPLPVVWADARAEAAACSLVYAPGVDLAATELVGRDYSDPRLGAVWDAACALQAQGVGIDLVTLEAQLARDAPGLVPIELLGQVADALVVVQPSHAGDYCRRVIDLSRRRALRQVLAAGVVDLDEDCDAVVARVTRQIDSAIRGRGGPLGTTARDGVMGAVRSLVEGQRYGISTGLGVLDVTLGGLGPGELAVVSGVTGAGKTALVIQIADWIAQHPRTAAPVLYLSGEMLAHDLWLRILCSRARLSLADLRRGATTADLQQLFAEGERSCRSKITIADDGMQIDRIESAIRRFSQEQPGGLVVIDHLDHIDVPAESQVMAITAAMRRIKAVALAARVPVILVAQLSRGYDGTRAPGIYDLKGGSSIEQYADSVWLLYYPDPAQNPAACQLRIAKNRRGPTGDCYLRFLARYTRFEERS